MFPYKDLLGLKNLSLPEIDFILNKALDFYKVVTAGNKKLNLLNGKSVFLMFYESSTRTSSSFDHAIKILGGNSISLAVSQSSVKKGESLVDTGRNLEAMLADAIIVRHSMAGAPHLLASSMKKCSIINAGDGQNEHPTQALLDILTMRLYFGENLSGLKIFITGDIKHSRVARSNIWALNKLGARVVVFGPPTLMPKGIEKIGCTVSKDLNEGISGANVVMGLRLQFERQTGGIIPSISEYSRFYGINTDNLRLADSKAIVMHPGPINRGAEMSGEVADGVQSVILKQVTAGLCVRMAVLDILINKR